MPNQSNPLDDLALECDIYEPIQTIKDYTSICTDELLENKIAEDAGCDSCVHYNKGKCNIYLKD